MLKIDGTVYEPVSADSYTIDYDLYMLQVLTDAGIVELLQQQSDAAPEILAQHALGKFAASGKATDFLAGCLCPFGQRWSRAVALTTAQRFANITDPADRGILTQLLLTGLADFFQLGTRSSLTFH